MLGEDHVRDQRRSVIAAEAEKERMARWTHSSMLASPARDLLWYQSPSHGTRQHAKNVRTALSNSAKYCDSSNTERERERERSLYPERRGRMLGILNGGQAAQLIHKIRCVCQGSSGSSNVQR